MVESSPKKEKNGRAIISVAQFIQRGKLDTKKGRKTKNDSNMFFKTIRLPSFAH